MKQLIRRLMYLRRGSRFHEELDQEIEFHIETRADELEQSGLSRREAIAQARRELGHAPFILEETRAAWQIRWLEDLATDLQYAGRTISRSPGFAAVAVLSLALGIGANTAIFSLVDTVVLKSLAVQNPDELQLLNWTGRWRPESLWGTYTPTKTGESTSISFSNPVFEELKTRNQSFAEMFAFHPTELNAVLNGHAFHVKSELVSGGYFRGLGVAAAAGRTITPDDDTTPGTNPIAVISHRFWRRHFNGAASALGANITLNGTAYTVIGVVGPDFHGVETTGGPDLWLPLSMQEQAIPGVKLLTASKTWWLRIIGRLKPGATEERARMELDLILRQSVAGQGLLDTQKPNPPRLEITSARSGLGSLRAQYSQPIIVLMILVALVLLIACVNLANLLLARAAARRRELGVRLALGASRGRLIRQLLTESLLLSFSGAALGLLFASWILVILPSMVNRSWEPPSMEFGLDARVLAFTIVISALTGIGFSLGPALRATRVEVTPLIRRGPAKGFHAGRALIVVQVALSLFLLIGAGLFVRTLIALKTLDTGFRSDSVLLFQVDPTLSGYAGPKLRDFYNQLQRNVEAIPGVRSASIAEQALISGRVSATNFSIEGYAPPDGAQMDTHTQRVAPRFFETMGIPILRGRAITEEDRASSPKVAVISENIARLYFGAHDPIGRRMGFGGPRWASEMEIVGVAKDAVYADLRKPPPPTVYVPFRQHGMSSATFAIRTAVDPKALIATVQRLVGSMDQTIPLSNFRTQNEQIDHSLRQERLVAQLCGFFSLTALLLTAIGVYGALAYAVERRTKELGIRIAVGATRRNVIWLVMRESAGLAMLGVACGVACAMATSHLVTKMLFGLQPNDPLTMAAAAAFLMAVAMFAAYLPGRRASRVDPLVALRQE